MSRTAGTRDDLAQTRVEEWFREFGARVLTRACADGSIEDALQDLWLYLLRRTPPGDVTSDRDRMFAWFMGAVRRRMLDQQRKAARRHEVALTDRTDFGTNLLSWLVDQETAERVKRVLESLSSSPSAPAAKLLELRYIDGRSVREIEQLLGVPARSVSARLQRAKKKFREEWRSLGGGGRKASELCQWQSIAKKLIRPEFRVAFWHFDRLHVGAESAIRFCEGTAMKRRPLHRLVFCPLLACLLGASSIAFDPGQPNPNPGGIANSLEGKGTFAVDPAENFINVVFFASNTKSTQLASIKATTNQNKWSASLAIFAGNYDSYAKLYTTTKGVVNIYSTGVVNVNVK